MTTRFQTLSISIDDAAFGAIARVCLATGRPANALSLEAMTELTDAANYLARQASLNAVILHAAPEVFCGGFDLSAAQRLGELSLAQRRELLSVGPRMCEAWQKIEALTFAAIDGWCVGGGVALVAACDFRVAGPQAQFAVPEIERGMNMSWGSLPRLVNLVGAARCKRLVILGQRIDAATALDWGLADEVAGDGLAVDAAMKLAQHAAQMPPVQLRMIKAGIDAYANALGPATSALDRDQFLLAMLSDDHAEGVRSFLEKRPARFSGN